MQTTMYRVFGNQSHTAATIAKFLKKKKKIRLDNNCPYAAKYTVINTLSAYRQVKQ